MNKQEATSRLHFLIHHKHLYSDAVSDVLIEFGFLSRHSDKKRHLKISTNLKWWVIGMTLHTENFGKEIKQYNIHSDGYTSRDFVMYEVTDVFPCGHCAPKSRCIMLSEKDRLDESPRTARGEQARETKNAVEIKKLNNRLQEGKVSMSEYKTAMKELIM